VDNGYYVWTMILLWGYVVYYIIKLYATINVDLIQTRQICCFYSNVFPSLIHIYMMTKCTISCSRWYFSRRSWAGTIEFQMYFFFYSTRYYITYHIFIQLVFTSIYLTVYWRSLFFFLGIILTRFIYMQCPFLVGTYTVI